MDHSVQRKIHRKWSFTGEQVTASQIALQAFLTIAGIFLILFLGFRRQLPPEDKTSARAGGVVRLMQTQGIRRQLDLRDPAAALLPDSPCGYFSLRPRREQGMNITVPSLRTKISPPPSPHSFSRLPERALAASLQPGNADTFPVSFHALQEAKLFSGDGEYLAAIPLPPADGGGKAGGETILKISGTGMLRQIVPVSSCGNLSRDRAAYDFLTLRHDPEGFYLVIWPPEAKR